jgi:hypothetical protein
MTSAFPLVALGGVLVVAAAVRRGRSRPPAPTCSTWAIPSPVPEDVAKRAGELLATGADYGTTLLETWGGRLYKFIVETHGPSPQNPQPHKGVGVRVCVGTGVPSDGGS